MKEPKILVVEDQFIIAFELKTALKEMGFVVCGTVASGEEAIAWAEKEQPDCVMMDVTIKGNINGIEAARSIRSRFGIGTVFMSGYPAEEMRRKTADVQPIGLFVKPLQYEELERTLRDYFLSRDSEIN